MIEYFEQRVVFVAFGDGGELFRRDDGAHHHFVRRTSRDVDSRRRVRGDEFGGVDGILQCNGEHRLCLTDGSLR